jgi:heterodisulfide reductase subunit C
MEVLDKVFLSEPVDSYYAARRRMGTLVSMACGRPATSCFCKVFGVDCAAPTADVITWLVNDTLYWEPQTEKGQALTEQLAGLLENAETAAVEAEQQKIRAIVGKLPYSNLSLEKWGAAAADKNFDSPLWEQLYSPCLACGTCTFVCPTCQCYDIRDFETGHGINRFRCWDSCMFSDFTKMAHGNPRLSQKERFRQRFMHKLVYYPENNDGLFSCVGCGRCLSRCPISMNIVKVMKKIGGNKGE